MNKLTDEILNKYIDGELDSSELDEMNAGLRKDDNFVTRLRALRTVHESLKQIETEHAPEGFTDRLMNLIVVKAKTVKHKVSYFFISVIGLLSIGILTVVLSILPLRQTGGPISVSSQFFNNAKTVANKNIAQLQKFLNDSSVIIVISVLLLILLFGAYFSADAHKNFKNRLNNISH